MNQEWSDDDNSEEDIELNQPNRDFPISEDEEEIEEEEEYDMYELAKLTSKNSMADSLFKKEEKPMKEPSIKESFKVPHKTILNIKQDQVVKQKRRFNPRLPPPNKYNKSDNNLNIKLNLNDFPSLKK